MWTTHSSSVSTGFGLSEGTSLCYKSSVNERATLYAVYHANGGILGELAYVAGKLWGTAHCALCDITHDGFREKEAFRRCRLQLPMPFQALHLNEQSAELAKFTHEKTPCVVLAGQDGFVMALDPEALESCDGDVVSFERKLLAFVESLS